MRKIIESTLVSADGVVDRPPLWAMDYRDVAGAGLPQFSNGHKTPLTLVSAKTFTTGVVVLSYRTAGA
ncbi:MAG TPA: hypothetical protein VGI37_09640 [Streptosporangiaceae bacterium]|jgi:hypothetical protein